MEWLELPADLAGPVDVELTHPVETIPSRFKSGSLVMEPKWDGYRISVVRSSAGAKLWSRQRNDLTDRFPDVAAAATGQLPAGVVLDGVI